MRNLAILLLAAASVLGFPQEKNALKTQDLTQLVQHIQETQNSVGDSDKRQAPRDCKAKCATSLAQKAAAEAKAAQAAQNAAGAQAAHMVKTQLAEKALQAAKAAEAALAGKQAVVEQLQQEVKEAEAVVAENTAAVRQQQSTVSTALLAANQAAAQHALMVKATQCACALAKTTNCALAKAKAGLELKCKHLAHSKARLACVKRKLAAACEDCAVTKKAACCACAAARAACGNARKKKQVNLITDLALAKSPKQNR